MRRVASLRTPSYVSKKAKGWGDCGRLRYCVEDPLEPELDTTRGPYPPSLLTITRERPHALLILQGIALLPF